MEGDQEKGKCSDFETNKVIMESKTQAARTKCQFHLEGRCRFGDECYNFHDPLVKMSSELESNLKKNKNGSSPKQKNCDGKVCKGKPKMRTAIDVIHRIQWDDSLPEELITIGYEDRFTGMQVKPIFSNIYLNRGLQDTLI